MSRRALAAVFAHPDDETFTMGGTLLRYAEQGVECRLYCATDGDAGRASGVAVSSRAELGALRRRELATAAEILGLRAVEFGGHPDADLAGVDADALVGEVVAFLRAHRPQVVVTFGPEGGRNTHRDHRAISRAATAAFHLSRVPTAYPEQLVGGREPHAPARLYYAAWRPPAAADSLVAHGLPVTAAIDVRARTQRKREAFLAHRTQRDHEARFEQLALTPEEYFALGAGVAQPASPVDDLFAGLER